jgi:prolyl 4-hydroxylase
MNNFILQDKLQDISICDDLITLFYKNKDSWGQGTSNYKIDHDVKKSTDLSINVNYIDEIPILKKYHQELDIIANNYATKYEYAKKGASFGITEAFNIQYYKPNEAFYGWHFERMSYDFPICHRHLVWMTYLNDVEDGETEFYYQNVKIKAEKGKTVIFPAEWTHTHRGIPSKTTDKFIITGWFNFIKLD